MSATIDMLAQDYSPENRSAFRDILIDSVNRGIDAAPKLDQKIWISLPDRDFQVFADNREASGLVSLARG